MTSIQVLRKMVHAKSEKELIRLAKIFWKLRDKDRRGYKMKLLALADLEKMNEKEIKEHIAEEYKTRDDLSSCNFLIAYESVGSWGCDSSSFYLFEKEGKLYEVHGSHCSCYGFEEQWEPEETSLEYLKSDKFYFSKGGYDEDDEKHDKLVKKYIQEMK